NAFKYTFEGEIAVSLRALDGSAELSVSDTGAGIPADQTAHLFERFHRVPSARARTHEGTGIGLSLVHQLVDLHGGEIAVASEVGRGSPFTVRLPFGDGHLPADRIGVPRTGEPTRLDGTYYVEEALRWLPDSDLAESPPTADQNEPSTQR